LIVKSGLLNYCLEKYSTITWKIEQDKPVLISEFGTGAKQELQDAMDTW